MIVLRSDINSPTPRFERLFVSWEDGTEGYLDIARFLGGAVLWCHNSASNSIAHKTIVEVVHKDPNASGEIHPYPGSEPQKFGPGLVVKIPIELAPGASKNFFPVQCVSPIYGCIALIGIGGEPIATTCCCNGMVDLSWMWLSKLPGTTNSKESRQQIRLVG